MRREGGEFLTIELASKLEKSTATRFLESTKFKVSHSLRKSYLGEEEECENESFIANNKNTVQRRLVQKLSLTHFKPC